MNARAALIDQLAERVCRVVNSRTVLVAIDGVDGAGKTVFADDLGVALNTRGRPVIRSSVDHFHNPRSVRYRLGRNSPEGFFEDSYNYECLRELLLNPLSEGGSGIYRSRAFDYRTDTAVIENPRQAQEGSILVFDGIFLHRDELHDYWDFSIFLDVPFSVSVPRGAKRGGSPDLNDLANRRYIDGQTLYLIACDPKRRATVVLNYENLDAPFAA